MKIIQPGHDVVSLFDISSQTQALTREKANRGLAVSLISAFLVVLFLGLALSLTQKLITRVENRASETTSETVQIINNQEPVAFQPSQVVSQHIATGQGYIGQ